MQPSALRSSSFALAVASAIAGCAGCSASGGGAGVGSGGGGGGGGGGAGGDTTTFAGELGGDGGAGGGGTTGGGSGDGGSTGGGTTSSGGLFVNGSVFDRDVSQSPVSPQSAAILATLPTFGSSANPYFDVTFDFHVWEATSSTPKATATLDWADESDALPFPVVPGGAIEGVSGYACPRTSEDCHYIVVDRSASKLFELYAATQVSAGQWVASSEAVWDLGRVYGDHERGFGCTSADAAGLPILPGLIRVKEIAVDHEIKHALRFILPNDKMRLRSMVAPASHYGAPSSTNPNAPPYGVRLRLKATFDETKVASAGGKVVVRALKRYGMILADGGTITLTAEKDDLTPEKYGAALGARDLRAIQPADFDVVELGTVQTFPSRPSCTMGQ